MQKKSSRDDMHDKLLAFCMGMHERLGEACPFSSILNEDVCKAIGMQFKNSAFREEAASSLPFLFRNIRVERGACEAVGRTLVYEDLSARCLLEEESLMHRNGYNVDVNFIPARQAVQELAGIMIDNAVQKHDELSEDNVDSEVTLYLQLGQGLKLPLANATSSRCRFCYDVPPGMYEDGGFLMQLDQLAEEFGYKYRAHLFSSSLMPGMPVLQHVLDVLNHIVLATQEQHCKDIRPWVFELFVLQACLFLNNSSSTEASMQREIYDMYVTDICFERQMMPGNKCMFNVGVMVFEEGNLVQIRCCHCDHHITS